jgi:hypothetical protein
MRVRWTARQKDNVGRFGAWRRFIASIN